MRQDPWHNSQTSQQGSMPRCAGQMAVQGNVGGGSFICGLKRVLSEYLSLDFQGAIGELTSLCCSGCAPPCRMYDPSASMHAILLCTWQKSRLAAVLIGACAGLKTFASLQSTRQLSEHTSAGLGLTWQPKVGVGLQLSSTRQLSNTTSADFSWVVGPRAAQGAALSVSRRGERLTTSTRLDVRHLS